jgi:stage II sporulation protein D
VLSRWFIFGLTIFAYNSVKAKVPMIDVKIARDQKIVSLTGTDLIINSAVFSKNLNDRKSYALNCISKRRSEFPSKPRYLASISSPTGVVKFDNKLYLGEIKLVSSYQSNACDVINRVELESYIKSLLANEMRSDWPIEALKAQAVAARSYALEKINSNEVSKLNGFESFYHVENSEKHQVSGSFNDEKQRTAIASSQTKGEVLITKTGKLVPIFFHAKCGGKTLKPEMVWSNPVEGYTEVTCPYCHETNQAQWSLELNQLDFKHNLNQILKLHYAENDKSKASMQLAPDRTYSRELNLYQSGELKAVKKAYFRKLLGRNKIRSNNFKVTKKADKLVLTGAGYGHGVGMCQHGAMALAQKGYSYQQILKHYFPHHEIKKIY